MTNCSVDVCVLYNCALNDLWKVSGPSVLFYDIKIDGKKKISKLF